MTPQEAQMVIQSIPDKIWDQLNNSEEEAMRIAADALDKKIPKKVKDIHVDEYYCPNCGSENNCNDGIVEDKYCPNCGQCLYIP